jgi:hypothetical protein
LTRTRAVFAVGFLGALALRVGFLRQFSGNYDFGSYAQVVAILRGGGDLYGEAVRYNYSPLWAHFLVGLDGLASLLGCSFGAAVGGFLTVVDAATALVLHRLAGGGRKGAAAALLFFANPVSIFVTSFHLQFDNVAVLCLLVAVLCAVRPAVSRAGAVAALSVSILVKHVTVFFPPLFLARPGRKGLAPLAAFVPYAVFGAAFLPYWRSWAGIRSNVIGYRSLAEDYGVAMLRAIPGAPAWLPSAVFVAAILAALVLLRRVELPRACLLLFLVMLVFVPGICEYYFVWPIALGALFGGAGYAVFTVVVASFFLGSPDGLNLPLTHLPGWHGVWWSVLLWLLWEVRRLGSRPASGIMAA